MHQRYLFASPVLEQGEKPRNQTEVCIRLHGYFLLAPYPNIGVRQLRFAKLSAT